MALRDYFQLAEESTSTHSWILAKHQIACLSVDDLAKSFADLIMQHRCRACRHHYEHWKLHLEGETVLPETSEKALKAFIEPVFGLPGNPQIHQDHLEGFIAEYLWYFLALEGLAGDNAIRIEPPGFTATDPGGDGLIIHRIDAANLLFRLWEIKKSSGTSTVSGTVSTAYKQLSAKATKYLARYTVIGQEINDPELTEFYGQLVDFWIDATPEAAAGVSVVVCVTRVPSRCFTTFGKRFPALTDPIRLRGMLTAVQDFPTFASKVREYVWKGL